MEATLLARNDTGEPYKVTVRFDGPRLMVQCTCPGMEPAKPSCPCPHIQGVLDGKIATLIEGADPGGFQAVQEWLVNAGRLLPEI